MTIVVKVALQSWYFCEKNVKIGKAVIQKMWNLMVSYGSKKSYWAYLAVQCDPHYDWHSVSSSTKWISKVVGIGRVAI